MEKRRVFITDTTLRDGHQSLLATRMKTEEMLPIAEQMNDVGFHSVEVWGGATFDSCIRYLDEDPWERLVKLKKIFTRTKLQMLLRGQNIVGYHHYPDDVVEEFIKKAISNGIDIIRIFDALNDLRNIEKAVEVTKSEGGHVQCALSYTISPLHNMDYFIDLAVAFQQMGADSICIKDMAGLLFPFEAHSLIGRLKEKIDIPIQLHAHYTSGMAAMTYLKAIEAGVDIVDTASAPLALGPSQPPTDSLVAVLRGTPYDTQLDLHKLAAISEYFTSVRKNHQCPEGMASGVDTNVLNYQIPGGMISNLASQLKEQNALDRQNEVLKEIVSVREDLGWPPLVTPSSQMVGTQAVFNVLSGERYKMISSEVRNYVKGLYGRPPGKINEVLQRKVLKREKPVTGRPADLLEPLMEKARAEIKPYISKDEDVLTYALFPNIALDFLKGRKQNKKPKEKQSQKEQYAVAVEPLALTNSIKKHGARGFKVSLDGESYDVIVAAGGAGFEQYAAAQGMDSPGVPQYRREKMSSQGRTVSSPLAGSITKVHVSEGDAVSAGKPLLVLEVMKMENIINASASGRVTKIHVKKGTSVKKGDPLVTIG